MGSVVGHVEVGKFEFSMETISVVFGKPPVSASLGGKIKYSQALRTIADPEKRRYDQVLRVSPSQATTLFDCSSRKVA